jgi:hypothetical protein
MKTSVLVVMDRAVLDDIVVTRDVNTIMSGVSDLKPLEVIVTAADADAVRGVSCTVENWRLAWRSPNLDKVVWLTCLRETEFGRAERMNPTTQDHGAVRPDNRESL